MTAGIRVEFEVGRIAADLQRRHPGSCVWWGPRTGSWWAVTEDRHGRPHLLEAGTPAEMARRLEIVRGPRVPQMRFRTHPAGPAGRARRPPQRRPPQRPPERRPPRSREGVLRRVIRAVWGGR